MIDLSDVTFVIPFAMDSPDRLRNLHITTRFLLRNFSTHILISEYAAEPKLDLRQWSMPARHSIQHHFFQNPHPYFQRTRSVNLAVKTISTPFFVIYDSDVLLCTRQYIEAAMLLRGRNADMCLPFSNRVMWIPQEGVESLPTPVNDDVLDGLRYEVSDDRHIFLGLVNFLNTRSFIESGMMNEHFKSWGYEEMELYMRLIKLGYSVLRTSGLAYHLDHYRGSDSSANHEYFEHNQQEYHRILAHNPDDLRRYTLSWPWLNDLMDDPMREAG
jgi:hypothetical protein